MPELIISDTSCLIVLDKIGHLDMLNCCYENIYTTPEVVTEYGLLLPEWIKMQSASNVILQQFLATTLDKGEASAITLATELEDARLILDDLKARKTAKSMNLKITGTLGVLVKAKQKDCISSIREIIELLRSTDFRMSETLIEEIIRQAGEHDT